MKLNMQETAQIFDAADTSNNNNSSSNSTSASNNKLSSADNNNNSNDEQKLAPNVTQLSSKLKTGQNVDPQHRQSQQQQQPMPMPVPVPVPAAAVAAAPPPPVQVSREEHASESETTQMPLQSLPLTDFETNTRSEEQQNDDEQRQHQQSANKPQSSGSNKLPEQTQKGHREQEAQRKDGDQEQRRHTTVVNVNSDSTNNNRSSCSSSNSNNTSNKERDQEACNGGLEQLAYVQRFLLRRWPLFALIVCVMSSLVLAILLALLTNQLHTCNCTPTSKIACSYSANNASATKSQSDTPTLNNELGVIESNDQSLGVNVNGQPFRRLPTSIWPLHYDLFFQPDLSSTFEFDGEAAIRFVCTQATNNITLHIKDLRIDDKWLRLDRSSSLQLSSVPLPNGNNNVSMGQIIDIKHNETTRDHDQVVSVPRITGWQHDKDLQHMIINLDSNLATDQEYTVFIKFKGSLNDELAGFYRIRYDDEAGKTWWIAATQFQATDARRAFPCFDEPAFKATFAIKIKHWSNMTALSNMPIAQIQSFNDGWTVDTFDKTHRMSTYLVAFAVTNFESRTQGNITVWARPNLVRTAEYALNIAGKILKRYEEFFGVSYPLPKMDMIALPDFNAGAMENWGLITYRETAMLYDNQTSSVGNKQRVATVVAHELAHQWFGNLVTPKWWDDLWLNEGFASYVEYIGVDHVEPGWKVLDQFVVEEVQDVFKADSLSTSHQISIPVNNPDEINEIFDRISYGKGASIIRMMNHFLTEKVFQAGLRRYLAALKYGNAEQSDLWNHLTQVQPAGSAVDVGKVMNSWTLQTGYPVVTLTRDYSKSTARLDQARFQLMTGFNSTGIDTMSRWEIPITFTTSKELNWEPITRLWLHQNDSGSVEIDKKYVPSPDDWILVNLRQVGYYRVNYDARNWQNLLNQLVQDHNKIEPINRAQILDDIFDLARNGMVDYKFAMNATKYLKREANFLSWDTVLRSFAFLDDMLQRSPIYGEWKEYIADLIEPYYSNYKNESWTISSPASEESSNDVLDQYNRVNAISWSCQVNKHCINRARQLFDQWKLTGHNNIEPSLRNILYCNVIENGDKSDWEFLWRVYEKEQNANERDRILRSLACSKELWILNRYLDWIFDKTKPIRRQDGTFVFRAVAKNNYGRDVAFNFLRDRWSTIKDYYGKTSFSFSNLIKSVAVSLNTQFELQQLKQFYRTVQSDVGTAKRSFLQSIEEVESNVDWMSKNYKTIESWIRETNGKLYL